MTGSYRKHIATNTISVPELLLCRSWIYSSGKFWIIQVKAEEIGLLISHSVEEKNQNVSMRYPSLNGVLWDVAIIPSWPGAMAPAAPFPSHLLQEDVAVLELARVTSQPTTCGHLQAVVLSDPKLSSFLSLDLALCHCFQSSKPGQDVRFCHCHCHQLGWNPHRVGRPADPCC